MALDYYNLGRKLKKSTRYLAKLNKQHNKLIIMQITYNAKYKIAVLSSEKEENFLPIHVTRN